MSRKAPEHGVDMYAVSRRGMAQGEVRFKPDPMSARFTGTAHLWPDVSNPHAREVIAAARGMLPLDTLYGPAFDDPEKCPPEIHDYQVWVNDALGRSGLAKGLAGGEAMLPDPTAHLPWPWRYLAQRYGPRNLRQLTQFMVRNLEWYVDQSKKLQDPWTIIANQLPMTMLLSVLSIAALATSTPLYQVHWSILFGIALLAAALVLAMQLIWGRDSHKYKTNVAELYHYLIREYSDAEEDPEADPEQYRIPLSRRYVI